ncbi:MAG TPA: zf-HC2 domain-containing protein [Bryobacteraceae bacterium]|nr:zf-HC2 domain-containing protein [Bryobacteraceae bacterium]
MNCERIREEIPELLADRLEGEARSRVIQHLGECPACRAVMAELGMVWRGLETMNEAEPSPALRNRFRETLGAWQEGFLEGRRSREREAPVVRMEPHPGRQTGTLARANWWWQAAAAALLLAIGGLGGRYLPASGAQPNEIAQLRGQVDNLRQLVALSLLEEQSPSSRIRGVEYSYRLARPDPDVEQALLRAVSHDSNVNVRLAAVDALAGFTGDAEVRRGLIDALPLENSPLVEIALVDLLAHADAREAEPALLRLAEDANADEAVRKRAAAVLEKWRGVQ